jgi:hypothetical protein
MHAEQILRTLDLAGRMAQESKGPLSVMRISVVPPSLISTVIAVAPASIAFSTSSFTTELGRSTTSPAAILSIVS